MNQGMGPSAQDRGPLVLTVTIIMLCLSTTSVVLRLVSRFGVVRRISKDDYAMILAWLIAFSFSFSVCYGTSVGLGRRQDPALSHNIGRLRKMEYVFSVLYNPALMATKSSICFFYLSLASNQRVFRRLTITTFVVVNVAGLAITLLSIFQCRPMGAAFADEQPPDAQCIDIVTLYLSSAPVNIVTDLALLVLPMPVLTSMRLPRNEKMILIVTFSFGLFVAVVDVVRIAYLEAAAMASLEEKLGPSDAGNNNAADYSYIIALCFMWSAIEVHTGIIVACVPGIKPLVAKTFPKLLGRIKAAGDSTRNNSNASPLATSRRASLLRKSFLLSAPVPIAVDNQTLVSSAPISPATLVNPGPSLDHVGSEKDQISDQDLPPALSRVLPLPSKATVLDFINMKNPRSMVKMTNKESLPYLAFVTIVFFLWGFAYGLLDMLNQQFQLIVDISDGQAMGLHSAYLGAYLVGPLTVGQLVLRRWGFKATFIVGLCVYGVGVLVFWPSAVLASFPAFLISNFIIGLGVSTLEIAGNPFIALCGPPEYAEVRLNVSQGVQAIGGVVSPIIARKVLFKNVMDAPSLIDVQWTYLGIALFDVALALVFYYVPLPEAPDADLDVMADNSKHSTCWWKTTSITLSLGVASQFFYVGAQEVVASYFQPYVATVAGEHSSPSSFDMLSIAHTAFATGRFLTALLGCYRLFKPRHLLLLFYLGSIVTAVLAATLPQYAGVIMLLLVYFCEASLFSLIYAISLRGLGRRTKSGAALLTAAISGGAVFPAAASAMDSRHGVQMVYYLAAAVFGVGAVFPIYLETSSSARNQVDPRPLIEVEDEAARTTNCPIEPVSRPSRRSWMPEKSPAEPP